MPSSNVVRAAGRAAAVAALIALVAACSSGPTESPPGEVVLEQPEPGPAVAAAAAPCSPAEHDRYTTVGPDGKTYATWHPANDPATGCSFGHEHGRDPHGSNLYATIGDVPFGYANARLDVYDAANPRHEDHVGHKIEWMNGVALQRTLDGTRVPIGVTCDFLIKIHQGTHSPDAFTNNLHEIAYHVTCSDGAELHATLLSAIGRPGEFVRSCDKKTVVKAGTPTPANSPAGNGVRLIPDASCVDKYVLVGAGQWSQYSLGLYEDWITSNYIRTADGRQIAYFDPHFAVFSPSRYYDAASATRLARTIDACYLERPVGERARGGECDWSTSSRTVTLGFDDPRSAFNGVKRETYFNQTTLSNAGGPTAWYTDPFGGHGSATPFPGAIKQYVAAMNNGRPYPLESQAFGGTRNYGGPGTHAPN
jgi:hypothetical protein